MQMNGVILRPFQQYSVISGQWGGNNEMKRAMEHNKCWSFVRNKDFIVFIQFSVCTHTVVYASYKYCTLTVRVNTRL